MEKKQRQIRSVWKKVSRRGAMGVGIGNLISMTIALIMGSAMKSPQMTIYDYARYTCASQRDRLCVRGGESVVRM